MAFSVLCFRLSLPPLHHPLKVYLLLLLIQSISPSNAQMEALLMIKSSIFDDPEGALSSWDPAINYCNWKGITCSPERQILSIDLSGLQLTGQISAAVGDTSLMSMVSLKLAHNKFSGEIPFSLGGLPNLREIDLSDNDLTGGIPEFLGDIYLFSLNLTFNNFSGVLPTEGQLKNFGCESFKGNPNLDGCNGGAPTPPLPEGAPAPPPPGKARAVGKAIAIIVGAIAAVISITLATNMVIICCICGTGNSVYINTRRSGSGAA